MFTKVFSILALGAVAVSASGYSTANVNGIDYSCNTSAVQCCGALQAPRNYNAADIAALVGVAVQDCANGAGNGRKRSPTNGRVSFQPEMTNSGPLQWHSTALSVTTPMGNLRQITGQLGVQCNPVTVIGAGTGANCASSPTCCEQNFQNQFLGINCTPATVGL
ncbi:hypothetical protein BJ165DRAFT_1593259 [Panaeolus papilionaceus]|nr:hypothetical protein BJ165DRAFT_1593259 [Panaeolus papilionaceus]